MPLSPLDLEETSLTEFIGDLQKRLFTRLGSAAFEELEQLIQLRTLLSLMQSRDETLSDQVNDSLSSRVLLVESIAGVTATTGSARNVNFDTLLLDQTGGDAEWDVSDPDVVTINTEGVWRIDAGVHWAALATGVRWGGVRLNGTTVICGSGPVAGHATVAPRNNMSRTMELDAGAELELRCYQDSGNNRTATGFLSLEYLGTAG